MKTYEVVLHKKLVKSDLLFLSGMGKNYKYRWLNPTADTNTHNLSKVMLSIE
jgi:hypothetical protein